jgi:serine/threonine protein kinase
MSSPNEDPDPSSAPPVPASPFAGGALEAGASINGVYRLVRRLGAGGMGEVWEARHERTKGRVALKVLLPEPGPGPRLGRARLRKRVDV